MGSEPAGCYSIVYVSTAIVDFSAADLVKLLKRAHGFNERAGITGVLMYGSGRFVQVLEGCPAAVRCLYARIVADPRHGRFQVLADGLVARREFTGWHMSFAPPPPGDFRALAGYLTPPQLVLAGAGAATQSILSEFLTASAEALLV